MLLFIVLSALIWVIILMYPNNTPKKTCDELDEPHYWITKKNENNEYLVCEKCGIMPNGYMEEG